MKHTHPQGRGFTLIEMMVTVAIVSVLASVAYPSYMEQVRKGRRAEGQAVLMEASQFMERYATENLRFDVDRAGTAVALPTALSAAPKSATSKFYNLSLQSVTQSTYILQAVPVNLQASDACGTMTLSDRGVKAALRSDCWKR